MSSPSTQSLPDRPRHVYEREDELLGRHKRIEIDPDGDVILKVTIKKAWMEQFEKSNQQSQVQQDGSMSPIVNMDRLMQWIQESLSQRITCPI
jgi:hypothetical protein